ncbi:lactate dehydrogenase [uncultured Clostridium sp.]|uniref:lactate/malate family dehydrogenase n=1 Tax=uncultured Clostridium sp. TaxID=59620 RepID=UPI003216505A
MFYYIFNNNLMISNKSVTRDDFISIDEDFCKNYTGKIFALTSINCEASRRSFIVSNENLLFLDKEDLSILKSSNKINKTIPIWLKNAIKEKRVISLNTNYPNFLDAIAYSTPQKWRINVVGLGDVGATLLIGLKLLGHDVISSLGIYDKDSKKMDRLNFELSQILSCEGKENNLSITPLKEEDLFNCDMFVFCVSVGIPPIGKEQKDVRLVQFDGNKKILKVYGQMARDAKFKGVFAVVSDPVDLLCKSLFVDSNRNKDGTLDFQGLVPEQIRGYGLGVMNGRAVYYSNLREDTKNYLQEGRAFGPHGEGLIIANSIENFNGSASDFLTEKTKAANLEVRATGFKPYIAPALSSGALSILDTIKGNFHYSSNFIGGTYMGCKNKFLNGCTENEILDLPVELMNRLENTYNLLNELYNKK